MSQLFFVSQSYHSPFVVLNYLSTYCTIGIRPTYSSVQILSFPVVVSSTKVLVTQLSSHLDFAPFTARVPNLRTQCIYSLSGHFMKRIDQ